MKRHRWFNVVALCNEIKTLIENEIEHSYLKKYIEKPLIDLDKIATLQFIFYDMEVSDQKKRHLMMTVMLVQIALDTHEQVTDEVVFDTAETQQQLSVLAGDYYSGLYYYILAKTGEVTLIRTLASAIKNINEQKMNLYHGNIGLWEELLQTCRDVDSLLFTTVAQLYGLSPNKIALINRVLYTKWLDKEMVRIQRQEFSYLQHYIARGIVEIGDQSIISVLEKEQTKNNSEINQLSEQVSYQFAQIKEIIFDQNMLSAVEEG